MKYNSEVSPFQVILISRCKTKRDTHNFFGRMPWMALPHIDSMGMQGQSLMTQFGITTIPALVLLDGNGTVVCLDGHTMITEDTVKETVDTIGPVPDLPPDPRHGSRGATRPVGTPPTFERAPL